MCVFMIVKQVKEERRGVCEVLGWDKSTFFLFHKLNTYIYIYIFIPLCVYIYYIGVFGKESRLFHFSLYRSLRKVFERYFCVNTNTFTKEIRAKLAPLTPLSEQVPVGWDEGLHHGPSLPGKFAPLHRTKTGIRQVDLLSRSPTASPLVHISLLSLSFVPISSLSRGYELLQSYQSSASTGGNASSKTPSENARTPAKACSHTMQKYEPGRVSPS